MDLPQPYVIKTISSARPTGVILPEGAKNGNVVRAVDGVVKTTPLIFYHYSG